MQTPVVWYDSVTVSRGGDAAWLGFRGALARASGLGRPAPGARGLVDLRSGDFLFDDNSVSVVRADSASWLRVEAQSGSRGAALSLGELGRHLWGVNGRWQRRRHSLEGAYSQRSASATLAAFEEQAARGESGALQYRYHGRRVELALRGERGITRHESLGELFPSLRDANESRAIAEIALPGGAVRAVRMEWNRTRVERRPPEGVESDEAFERIGQSAWGALRWETPVGESRLRLDLGGGRHGPLDRIEWAPGVDYLFRAGPLAARAGLQRVLTPVWTDLARSQPAFLQRTWAGVLELEAGQAGVRRAKAGFLIGRTWDRALFHRLPLEEEWLRLGARRDPSTFDFALVTLEGEWRWDPLRFAGEGFALARDRSALQSKVDPGIGARGSVEWRGSLFGGDLGLLIRGEAEGVGPRESEGGIEELCGDPELIPPRTLPGYVTFGATAGATLGTALVSVRIRNLEDRLRPQSWVDCDTFEEALGTGREMRFALTVRLSN